MEATTTKLWTIKSVLKLVIGILLGGLFYYHIFIPQNSSRVITAGLAFDIENKNTRNEFNNVREVFKKEPELISYEKARAKKQIAFNNLKSAKKDQRYFGFKSRHFWSERFGGNTLNFIFGVWVLYMFMSRSKPNMWSYMFVTLYLTTKYFTFYWIFQRFQDFPPVAYHIMTVGSSLLMFFIIYFYLKFRKTTEQKLIEQRNNSINAALFYIQEDKKEEIQKIFLENLK